MNRAVATPVPFLLEGRFPCSFPIGLIVATLGSDPLIFFFVSVLVIGLVGDSSDHVSNMESLFLNKWCYFCVTVWADDVTIGVLL